jgi:hypothetical protein
LRAFGGADTVAGPLTRRAAQAMRTRRRATIEDLRQAIDCLPRHTRIAMLEGIAANDIIVGAYSTQEGICPMLAAHRAGGRTSLIAFAEAWDRVAFRGQRAARARRATERELLILRSHLEASLLEEDASEDELAIARREHEALLARVNPRDDDYAIIIRRLRRARTEVERGEPALTA